MSDPLTIDRASRAVVTGDIDILRGRYETVVESSVVLAFMDARGEVRMQGFASRANALFMGIAPTTAVHEYLEGVAHAEITDRELDNASVRNVEYTTNDGTRMPDAPGTETFWVASVAGTGPQTLDWTIKSGDWTAMIMNADASSPVTVELAFGAVPSNIIRIAWISLAVALPALLGGGLLIYLALRRRDADSMSLPANPRNEQSA